MKKTIKIMSIIPGEHPTVHEIDFANSYNEIRQIVGGYLTPIRFIQGTQIFCDEEGDLKDHLADNIMATKLIDKAKVKVNMRTCIRGPVVVVGTISPETGRLSEETEGLSDEQIQKIEKMVDEVIAKG